MVEQTIRRERHDCNSSMTAHMLRRDRLWIRHDNQLITGSPVRFFRLSDTGRATVVDLENGAAPTQEHDPLTERLITAGALHPLVEGHLDAALVTVVIPAYAAKAAHLRRLQALVDALGGLPVIVIDDASPIAVHVSHATVVRLDSNSGPAAARNHGLGLVETPFVAFIDSDIHITRADVCVLAAQLTNHVAVQHRVAAKVVAPRVLASKRRSILARFERNTAPLDMGRHATKVAHGARVSYVPSAVLVCETATVRDLHGFDDTLRCGEDVDLVWRLIAADVVVRYEPSVTCTHETRRGLLPFLTQRFNYGSSTVDLATRHRGRLAPLRARPTSVMSWVCLGAGWPAVALACALLDLAFMTQQFKRQHITNRLMLAMFVKNFLNTGDRLADAVVKVWWPIIVVMATFSDSVSGLLALSIAVPGLIAYVRQPTLDPFSFLFLRTLEKFSYGAGVWVKGFSARDMNALLPRFLPMSNSSVSG